MNSCVRCGNKFQHNYLVTLFKMIKEKQEKMMVCLKCRDLLSKETPEA